MKPKTISTVFGIHYTSLIMTMLIWTSDSMSDKNNKPNFDLDKLYRDYTNTKSLKVPELYILGLLSFKDASGYDIYKLIAKKSEAAGSFLRLNKATIYNTMARMTDDGLIEIKEIVTDTKRPNKSIFRLTAKGQEYLKEILFNEFSNPPWVFVNFTLPLRFSKILTTEELRVIIKLKIKPEDIITEKK